MGVIHPDQESMAAFACDERKTSIMMLNFLRYREHAAYPDARSDGNVSGRVAYGRYGAAVMPLLEKAGGRVLWAAACENLVIGDPEERCDDVVAIWYPNRQALLKMLESPEYQAAHVHREAALERGALYACSGASAPTAAFNGPNPPA